MPDAHHGDHDHRHGPPASQGKLFWALMLTGGFMFVEAAGGLIAGSLALLADAAHMLTDAASLAMGYAAVRAAARPATPAMSYGHHRWQVLAAFVNGLGLLVLSAWILVEAGQRLQSSVQVEGGIVAAIAAVGLLINIAAYWVLSRGESNLNVRGALAHVASDLMGSIAALAAGAVIVATGWMPIDPILSALVALLMIRSGWTIARQSAHVLLEGAPPHFDIAAVEAELKGIPGVSSIHHVHAWSLAGESTIVTLHAEIVEGADRQQVLKVVLGRLRESFGVVHATVQIEDGACAAPDQADDCHGSLGH